MSIVELLKEKGFKVTEIKKELTVIRNVNYH